jgi:hypothetical protein
MTLPTTRTRRSVWRIATFLITSACFTLSVLAAGAQEKEKEDEKPSGKLESVTVKRRTQTTDEDLRKQLLTVPEVGLDQPGADILYGPIVKAGAKLNTLPPDHGKSTYFALAAKIKREDMVFLPWINGPDAAIGPEKAGALHTLSNKLRDSLRASVPTGDVRPDPVKLRALLTDKEWDTPTALPTLTQMMQAENAPVRMLLIDMLTRIKGKEATQAIVRRAIFDISPEVREKAVQALADRAPEEYGPMLYAAFRYPWPPAADHAAEALVALQRKEAVKGLIELLRAPNPNMPYKVEQPVQPVAPAKTDKQPKAKEKDQQVYALNEVVRVNHLCNCMVCHAPSLAKDDMVRGRVPLPGEDPPPLYYRASSGLFVRADVTYIRQDFSVVQPVEKPGKWSGNQRYDYLVRTRPLTQQEVKTFEQLVKDDKLPKTSPQQEAVLYALRQLTGQDYGTTHEQWAAGVQKANATQPTPAPAPTPKADPQPDPKPKTEPQPDPKPKTDPKTEPQPEPKTKTDPKPQPDPKGKPDPAKQADPKPQPPKPE